MMYVMLTLVCNTRVTKNQEKDSMSKAYVNQVLLLDHRLNWRDNDAYAKSNTVEYNKC